MRRALQVALVAAIVLTVVAVALPEGRAALVGCVGWLRGAGTAGRVASVLLVLVGLPFGVPTLWLAALLGYLHGVAIGLALALTAIPIGATATFVVSRWLFRDDVARLVVRRPRWRASIDALGTGGVRMVVLLRIAGPHNLLNVLLAASPLTTRQFAIGTAIGSLPSVALATIGGALAPNAAALWEAGEALGPAGTILAVVGAATLLAAILLVRRAARRALALATSTAPAAPSPASEA